MHGILILLALICTNLYAQTIPPKLIFVDSGWAGNSVNTTIFRKNSLASFGETQFISYYNADGFVMLGKRKIGSSKWQIAQTQYKGNIKDAHNSISIVIDDSGYLHMAWSQHNNQLNYCQSKRPLSLELTNKLTMTGHLENSVSYPEFYAAPNHTLYFLYRDGSSGNGNLVMNTYNLKQKKWIQLHHNLINGEGKRNAYWQTCIDAKGSIHLSWVWRESPDIASNHDMCYAVSKDGGVSWQKSTGEKYQLPITAATAEYAAIIPQQHELINQTAMVTDFNGNPIIASYWEDDSSCCPQYHLVYKQQNKWVQQDLAFRKTAFTLAGAGTKKIPIARPQLIVWKNSNAVSLALIFRDAERGSKVSLAICKNLYAKPTWKLIDLSEDYVESWEPTYDAALWKEKKLLHLFVQRTSQADAEGLTSIPPQAIYVLEWKPSIFK